MVTNARGFTLIEAMLVVGIAAVLAAVALPNFTQFVRDQRIKTASFELFATLTLARSEAVTRNTNVTVAATGGDWANGWQVSAGTEVLRKQDALPNITITRNPATPTNVVYTGSGRLSTSPAPTFELNSSGGSVTMRCISVDLTGRPVSKASAC